MDVIDAEALLHACARRSEAAGEDGCFKAKKHFKCEHRADAFGERNGAKQGKTCSAGSL